MSDMNGYGLAAAVVSAVASLAWPAAFAFCIWLLKDEISKALPNLRVKHGESELSFRQAQQVFEEGQDSVVSQLSKPAAPKATDDLSPLTNDQLRERVGEVARDMRRMQSEFKQEYDLELSAVTDDQSWAEKTKSILQEHSARAARWQEELQPMAKALRDELLRRIGKNGRDFSEGFFTIEQGALAGPSPLVSAALELEQMARALPPQRG